MKNDIQECFDKRFIDYMMNSENFDDLAEKINEEDINIIIAITEWDDGIVKEVNKKTVCYWYSLYLLYDYEEDTIAGYYHDEIYQFMDCITLN